jgi:hypothetical protein
LPDFLVFDEDLRRRNEIHCCYMMALGYTGLNETDAAEQMFRQVLHVEPNHLGALAHRHFRVDKTT